MGTGEIGQRPRRRMPVRSRLLVVFTLVTLAFIALAPATSATRAWCRTDPLVAFDGTLADIFVSGPLEAPLKVTGPTKIVIVVPEGVDTLLILNDLGFGKGYDVSFEESKRLRKSRKGIEIVVRTYVPTTDDSMPVQVEFSPRLLGVLSLESVEGTANEWITLKTVLKTGVL